MVSESVLAEGHLIPADNGVSRRLWTLLRGTLSGNRTAVRFLRGAGWQIIGATASQGGSLLVSVILARLLGKAIFGQYAFVLTTIIAITSIGGLGLGVTATKYVSQYRDTDPNRVGRILGLTSAIAVAAAVCLSIAVGSLAPWLAGASGSSQITAAFRLSTAYVFYTTLSGYQLGALAGFEAFRSIARIGVTYGMANVGLSALLTYYVGLRGGVLAQCAGAALLWMLYRNALSRECLARGIAIRFRGALTERAILYRFSLPAAACGLVSPLAIWWCNSFLVHSSGYTELAVYTAISSMRSIVLFIPALIARVGAPVLNNMLATGASLNYRRLFRSTVAGSASLAFLVAAFLWFAGERFLHAFGDDFVGPRVVIAILLGSVVLEVVATALYQTLFTTGRLWRNLGINIIWSLVLVVVATRTIPHLGACGLALSYAFAWTVSTVLYGLAAHRQSRRISE